MDISKKKKITGYELVMKIIWNLIIAVGIGYILFGFISVFFFSDKSVNFQSFNMWYWFN
tara:strand:- start:164 stop:340 length:177 start_codon:yes stop_codon:yes gene_type:complete